MQPTLKRQRIKFHCLEGLSIYRDYLEFYTGDLSFCLPFIYLVVDIHENSLDTYFILGHNPILLH